MTATRRTPAERAASEGSVAFLGRSTLVCAGLIILFLVLSIAYGENALDPDIQPLMSWLTFIATVLGCFAAVRFLHGRSQ
jgi:hypothetical protein